MSLRVWLPLNGSLENKGLSDINLTGSPIYATGGKIGNQCLASQLGWFEIPDMAGKKQMSFAYWVKINTATSTNWLDTFSWYSTDGSTNYRSRQEFYTNSTQTGVWFQGGSIGTVFKNTVGDWNHYVFTIDYDKGEAKFYINGEELANPILTVDTTHYIKGIGSAFLLRESALDSHINDFRLYDHILSPFEVKQISQGLVLHYPLNHGGLGQENLLANSQLNASWEYPTSGHKDKYAPITLKVPTESMYTLSFEAKSTVAGDKIRTHFYSPNTTTTCTSNQGLSKTAGDGNMDFTLSTKWERYWVVYHQNETTAVKHVICPRMSAGSGTGIVSIRNVKLEAGDKPTPWSPAPSDDLYSIIGGDDTIEYDCSGYGNNGTKIGTLDYSSDTPRYNVSTHFGATNSKIRIDNLITTGFSNSYTFSWWGKYTTLGNSMFWGFQNGVRLNGVYHGIYWNTSDGTSNPIYKPGTTTIVTAPEANVWHHYVMTGDNTVCKLYVDGELYGQAKAHKTISGNIIYINGWDSGTSYSFTDMDMSDFRIYCTALSPEDVLDLYNLGAAIDTNNNLYGVMLEEG